MKLIAKQRDASNDETSVAARYAKTTESKNYLKDIFPVGGPLHLWNKQKDIEGARSFKLEQKDNGDFRIPLDVFLEYETVLFPLKMELRSIVMAAVGVRIDDLEPKVEWE